MENIYWIISIYIYSDIYVKKSLNLLFKKVYSSKDMVHIIYTFYINTYFLNNYNLKAHLTPLNVMNIKLFKFISSMVWSFT